MISKKLFLKAQNIPVVSVEEGPKKVYINMVYCDSEGRHEHTISWNKDDEPTLENMKDILWCDCFICSNYNVLNHDYCALKIRAIKELTLKDYWQPELWNTLVEEIMWQT